MLLYNNMLSGNCYKVRLLFAHLGIDYERQELDVVDRSNRLHVLGDLNPALRVPTLVFDDGRSLAESGAIIFHFAQGSDYLPEDAFERAQVLQWLFFEQYSLEPHIAVLRFYELAGIHAPTAEVQAKRAAGVLALEALESHLGGRDFLVGEGYTIADIALFAYTHVAPEGGFSLQAYPAVRRWITRVAAQPGHIAITDG
jgi:glutathione S-transferase